MADSGDDNTIAFPTRRNDGDTLGGRIWRARDALDMSLEALAERLGIPLETVSDWERDHAEPGPHSLFMLAGVLGVAPSWLMAGIGEAPPEADAVEEPATHPLEVQLRQLRALHAQTGEAIAALEAAILQLSPQSCKE